MMMDAFVLAGGLSTRMGRDKALLEIGGRPLVEHMLELLRDVGLSPRICGSRPELARFAEVVPDNFPQCGPLGGIEAALAISDSDLNFFVPVDAPELPRGFLLWLMERAERSQAAATIPHFGGRLQPLCAVYNRRLLNGLGQSLTAGNYKVIAAVRETAAMVGEAVDEFNVESVAPTLRPGDWSSNRPLASWFRNVNTPEEYEALCAASGVNDRHPIS
jgi:molybdopterin-guanine dinucleotide biosynthesis protein A